MTSILVLLALLSVATLASRRGSAEAVVNLASAPLLVTMGFVMGPEGLGFLLPSTAAALTPGLRVGVAWLAFLVGLRASVPGDGAWLRNVGWLVVVGGLSCAVTTAIAYAGIVSLDGFQVQLPGLLGQGVPRWAFALALGGMLCGTSLSAIQEAVLKWPDGAARRRLEFLARHDAVLGVLTLVVVLAVWVTWRPPDVRHAHALPVIAVGALGSVMAAGAVMLGAARRPVPTIARLSVVALLTTGAGLSGIAGVPEASAAWFTGFLLAALGVKDRLLSQTMRDTDRPVRFVLLVLAGVHAEPTTGALLMGTLLCAARFVTRALVWLLSRPEKPGTLSFQAMLTAPALAVPFAMSLTLARRANFEGTSLLTAVVVAVCLNDLLTLLWGFGQRARTGSITFPALPAVHAEVPRE